mmetsp:Transcript_18783/g.33996  ORF Transcript_18783/g.33996 Transcript_18783/m.33996 type:complete len:149 (-) Transcript_18783:862-1308(-)
MQETTALFGTNSEDKTLAHFKNSTTNNKKTIDKVRCIQIQETIVSRMASTMDAVVAFELETAKPDACGDTLLRLSFASLDATGLAFSLSTHSKRSRSISKHWTRFASWNNSTVLVSLDTTVEDSSCSVHTIKTKEKECTMEVFSTEKG